MEKHSFERSFSKLSFLVKLEVKSIFDTSLL